MPPLAKCQGCCVKLVQNVGTDYKSVRLIVFIYHWNWFYLNNLEKVEATNLLNRPLETFNICFCRRTCTDRIDINLWLVHHGEDFAENFFFLNSIFQAAWLREGDEVTCVSVKKMIATLLKQYSVPSSPHSLCFQHCPVLFCDLWSQTLFIFFNISWAWEQAQLALFVQFNGSENKYIRLDIFQICS